MKTTEKIELDQDEAILIQVRKHWFILVSQMIGILVGAIFPIIFIQVLAYTEAFNTPWFRAFFDPAVLVALYTGWLLVLWMALFSVWTNYYLDVWTITTKRLIAVDQRGLFNRTTGSFRLERLQDVNVSISGLIPTFLDFGNVHAETASGDSDFVAYNVPHPQELKALIMSASDATTYATPEKTARLEV